MSGPDCASTLNPQAADEAARDSGRIAGLESQQAVPGAVLRQVVRVSAAEVSAGVEFVVDEVPVALVYNGISHAVMLATPNDIADFALGFSLSEGILNSPRELYGCEAIEASSGIEVHLDIAGERFLALKERRRSMAGRTGCGLCGVESLAALERMPVPIVGAPTIAAAAICRALGSLRRHQRLHHVTHGAHAACWADLGGNIELVREDVGRHNALDKLLGALARRGFAPGAGFVGVTSRASYEMVQKVASLGIGTLAAVAAPTAFAVRIAEAADMNLLASVRGDAVTVHSGRVAEELNRTQA